MKLRTEVWGFFQDHTTKLLGFAQVTAGVLAVADPQLISDLFGPNGLKWVILISGLLTAWRGFVNTINIRKSEAPPYVPPPTGG